MFGELIREAMKNTQDPKEASMSNTRNLNY